MRVFQSLWRDRMDIYRWKEKADGKFTGNEKELKYSDVKCHYSRGATTNIPEGSAPEINNTSHKLFCSIDADLQEGDSVVVTQRNGNQITLDVGEGFSYSGHQEFSVKRNDTA